VPTKFPWNLLVKVLWKSVCICPCYSKKSSVLHVDSQCSFYCAVLPRLDTAPRFLASKETWIKIRWLRWNGLIEPPLLLHYQVEYQLSNPSKGSDWLRGPLVPHTVQSLTEYMDARVSDLTRNTFYDFRVRPLLRDADDQWTNASASPRSSPYRTGCSGMWLCAVLQCYLALAYCK